MKSVSNIRNAAIAWATVAAAVLLAGCSTLGPDYKRPSIASPESFKSAVSENWKQGEPLDHLPKGPWWAQFGDAQLDALMEQSLEANQELKIALAAVEEARAAARFARGAWWPSLVGAAGIRRERFSPNQEPGFGAATADTSQAGLELNYELDLWGRNRRDVEASQAEAASSVAAYRNASLVLQADLAQNYFGLRALDAEIGVVRRAIALRLEQEGIVASRLDSGLGNELDVARAKTEVAVAQAELAALLRRRSELENAIAILVGTPPSSFRLEAVDGEYSKNDSFAFEVPVGLPSRLLERRPDIAEAERQLMADNARIGVARAAFFPAISLTAAGGVVSSEVKSLFDWDSRAWAVGPSLYMPLFAGGRNAANLDRAQARYEAATARYRQRVLIAFGEVENALSDLKHLSDEASAQARALASARETRDLAAESFEIGVVGYLDVIEADRAALESELAQAQLAGLRRIATVQLVKALGGGWDEARETEWADHRGRAAAQVEETGS